MSNIQLASKIIRGVWLMDQSAAESYLPMAFQFLTGNAPFTIAANTETEERESKETKMFALSPLHEMKRYNSLEDAPEGSVAVIPVTGALSKNDYCGTPGTATLANRVLAADRHRNIKGIILKIDSPGGHVDGTENFSKAISATKKPVITVVDGLMASAAYWIGSSANEVLVSDRSAMIGSIGTMITLADFKGYYEKQGLKVHEVYADKSTKKNEVFAKAIAGDYKPLQEKLLNPTNELFLGAVRNNRSGKLTDEEAVLNGEIFMAEKAIELGLADGFGGISEAIERIDSLTSSSTSDTNSSNTNMKIDMSKYPNALKAFGVESMESDDSGVSLQVEHLDSLEQALSDGASAIEQVGTLTTEKANLETQLKAEEEKVKNLTTEKENLESENTNFKANYVPAPGAAANAEDGGNKTNEFYSEADAELERVSKINQI